jgi:hypothetical protein
VSEGESRLAVPDKLRELGSQLRQDLLTKPTLTCAGPGCQGPPRWIFIVGLVADRDRVCVGALRDRGVMCPRTPRAYFGTRPGLATGSETWCLIGVPADGLRPLDDSSWHRRRKCSHATGDTPFALRRVPDRSTPLLPRTDARTLPLSAARVIAIPAPHSPGAFRQTRARPADPRSGQARTRRRCASRRPDVAVRPRGSKRPVCERGVDAPREQSLPHHALRAADSAALSERRTLALSE